MKEVERSLCEMGTLGFSADLCPRFRMHAGSSCSLVHFYQQDLSVTEQIFPPVVELR
jgi:hypothetical protein